VCNTQAVPATVRFLLFAKNIALCLQCHCQSAGRQHKVERARRPAFYHSCLVFTEDETKRAVAHFLFFTYFTMFSCVRRVVLTGAWVLVCAFAQAQTQLNEVVVTAHKFPQKQSQSGKVTTILSDSVLRAYAGRSLSEVLTQQVGIQLIGAHQPLGSVQSLSIRGAGYGSALILLDGVPIFDPSNLSNAFDLNWIAIEQLERIEILKGGQSTLYGSDAIAGVINLITKKNGNHARMSQTAGNLGTFRSDAQGQWTQKNNQWAGGVTHVRSNGFSAAQGDGFEPDGFQSMHVNAGWRRQWNEQLSTSISGQWNRFHAGADEGAFIDDLDFNTQSTQGLLRGGVSYQGKKALWQATYQWDKSNRSFVNDSTFVPANAFSKWSQSTFEALSHFGEVTRTQNIRPGLTWLAGIDFRNQRMGQTYSSISSFGLFEDSPILPASTHITQWSAFTSWVATISDQFGFEVGGRGNYHSLYQTNASYTVNPYWQPVKGLKILGVWATSFKNPSLYQLYSAYGNLDLKPETAQTLDAGLDYQKNNFRVRSIYFQRWVNQVIFFQSLPQAPFGQYINLLRQQDHGLETELSGNYRNWTWDVNHTYTQGFRVESNAMGDEIRSGNLLRRAKHVWNGSLSWKANSKLVLSIQGQYIGDRTDRFYNAKTFKTEDVELPAYFLAHAQASYRLASQWKIQAGIQNALNTSFQEVYGFNSRPRQWQVGVHYDFQPKAKK